MNRFPIYLAVLTALALPAARSQQPDPAATPAQFEPNPYAADALAPAPSPVPMARVVFRGATAFPEAELREVVAEQLGGIASSGLTPAAADDTAFFLAIFYRKQGYSQVEITEEISSGGGLILNVEEGPLTSAGDTVFNGNNFVDDETLKGYLLGATYERLSEGGDDIPFIEGDILTGVERIRGYYLSEGFLDSEISEPKIEISKSGERADITVGIKEGTRYLVGPTAIGGDLVFRSKASKSELKGILQKYEGLPYTSTQVQNLRRAVVFFYKKRGYFKVGITASSDPTQAVKGLVPIQLYIDSGALYRFDGVTQKGLDRLRPSFLERRFGKLSGQIYDPDKVGEVFREMMRTGLFTRLQVNQKALDSDEVRLDLVVEEAKSKELGFSLGYGTFEGVFVGISAGERNLFGTGRSLTGSVEVSQIYRSGELVFHDQWFLESPYDLRIRLNTLTTNFKGYTVSQTGLKVALSRKITEELEVGAFLQGRQATVTSTGIDEDFLGPVDYVVTAPGVSLSLDYRDSPLNPRSGWIASASVETASSVLGGDLDYVRAIYRASYYIPLGIDKKFLLALGARGGVISTSGGRLSLPIDERFFNGGSRSVRSFAERELGPRDSTDYPVGGQSFATYNVEFVYPIAGGLQGALFLDAGSVGTDGFTGINDLRYGIGAGLRYGLPVGPLRLDYGVNPAPRAGEAFGAFHFSFGFAF